MKRPDSILANLYYQKVPKLPKFQSKGQVNIPGVTDFVMPRLSNESTSLGTKIDEAAIRQAQIDRQRQAQGQIKKAEPKRSAASKALAIATHPMTALAYKVKGQDIPENFEKGERNILDNAVDIVNPFSYVDQARQVKEDINQGNYLAAGIGSLGIIPGEGAFERGAGKFLHNKKRITLDDFESTINYHLGEGLGIKKNPTNLRVKVRPGDLYPEIHAAENAPKFTVDLYNEGRHSGFVGLDKLNTVDYNIPGKKGTIYTKVADYPYEFSKLGKDALKGSGISGELNKALTNALQEYDLGKLYSSTVHTDEGLARWKNLVEKGKAKEVAPNRFELYKQGGIIKDDRGQLPKAQNGLNIPGVPGFKMTPPVSESTAHFFYNPILGRATSTATTGQSKENIAASTRDMGKAKQRERDEEKQRVAERKAAKAIQDGKTKTFTFPTGETKSLDQMNFREREYVAGKSLESRGRINEDKEAWYDSVNPLSWYADMAGALGAAPYEAQQSGSNMPYVSAIVNPLLMGRMMGSGSMNPISKKFWTNEVSNPEFLNNLAGGIPKSTVRRLGHGMYKVGRHLPAFGEHVMGLGHGMVDLTYGRKFFETFPITNAQRAKMILRQDEAFNKGNNFIQDWFYPNAENELRPEVEQRITDIEPRLKKWNSGLDYNFSNNPMANTTNVITSSRTKDVLNNPLLTEEEKEYILFNRGKIEGVNNYDPTVGKRKSITLRNTGLYYHTPTSIRNTANHEYAHSSQHLGSFPWRDVITSRTPDNIYYEANLNTPIGKEFKDAMVESVPNKYTWEAAPIEFHSELMTARQKAVNDLVNEYGYTREQAMDYLQKPGDAWVDHLIDLGNLNRFFKPKTTEEVKRKLIRALPSVITGTVGAAALEQKKDGGNIKLGQNMTVTTEQLEELKRQGYKIQML